MPLLRPRVPAPASSASRAPGVTAARRWPRRRFLELPYPGGERDRGGLARGAERSLLASELPDRPIVLGGCCCSHVGAIEALSAGEECLAVVWIDAHGDLNTPHDLAVRQRVGNAAADGDRRRRRAPAATSRSSAPGTSTRPRWSSSRRQAANRRGCDRAGAGGRGRRLRRARLRLVRSRRAGRLHARARRPQAHEVEALLEDLSSRIRVAGLGFTGLVRDDANEPKLVRLAAALGL